MLHPENCMPKNADINSYNNYIYIYIRSYINIDHDINDMICQLNLCTEPTYTLCSINIINTITIIIMLLYYYCCCSIKNLCFQTWT